MLLEDFCWGKAEAFEDAWAEGVDQDICCCQEAEQDFVGGGVAEVEGYGGFVPG
jgi:hypothetical protein